MDEWQMISADRAWIGPKGGQDEIQLTITEETKIRAFGGRRIDVP